MSYFNPFQGKLSTTAINFFLTILIAFCGALILYELQWPVMLVGVVSATIALPLGDFSTTWYQKGGSNLSKIDVLQLCVGIIIAVILDSVLYFWYF
jgi:hypothetical protein